jgi:beta-alanine--pyruvate transaminase
LIFDEVITAFGRLGHAFAAERYGVVPDMICFAKGVTNGAVPMSGVIVRQGVHDALMQGPEHIVELFHGYTYSGHPLATAAALATLDVLRDEDLAARALAHEADFITRMLSLRDAPNVLDIRPVGLMCGIDLAAHQDGGGIRGMEVTERAFHEHDMYIRVAGDTIVVAPPLIASADDLDQIRDRIAGVLRAVA